MQSCIYYCFSQFQNFNHRIRFCYQNGVDRTRSTCSGRWEENFELFVASTPSNNTIKIYNYFMYNPPIPGTTFFSLFDDTPSSKPENNFPTIYIPGKQVLMSLDKELDLICFICCSVIAVG